jgi:hypothetical protein
MPSFIGPISCRLAIDVLEINLGASVDEQLNNVEVSGGRHKL